MGWFLLILVLLAAAFGVLGVVLKVTAILVFTIVLTTVILGALGLWFFRRTARRLASDFGRPRSSSSPRPPTDGLPQAHDDRY
jgi:peptidoglycan/LPS O-acetylase OafA/YrhL